MFYFINQVDYEKFVNTTYRGHGAVGKNAVVPKYVAQISNYKDLILDFGAGKEAIHTLWLRSLGRCVSALDIGSNYDPKIHVQNLEKDYYHIVFLSNVINIQPTLTHFNIRIGEALYCLKGYGQLVFNFPTKPRKCLELTDKLIKDSLCHLFKEFYFVNPNIYHFKFYID